MNRAKENWFYKLCVKQCVKDMSWVFIGIVSIIIAVFLIATSGGLLSFLLFFGIGVVMIILGGESLFKKLPAVRARLDAMAPDEFEGLGQTAPECVNKTFYFTKKYLCAPVVYDIFSYENISDIDIREKIYKGRRTGAYVDVSFDDGSPKRTIPVYDKKFFANTDDFRALIEQYKTNV